MSLEALEKKLLKIGQNVAKYTYWDQVTNEVLSAFEFVTSYDNSNELPTKTKQAIAKLDRLGLDITQDTKTALYLQEIGQELASEGLIGYYETNNELEEALINKYNQDKQNKNKYQESINVIRLYEVLTRINVPLFVMFLICCFNFVYSEFLKFLNFLALKSKTQTKGFFVKLVKIRDFLFDKFLFSFGLINNYFRSFLRFAFNSS